MLFCFTPCCVLSPLETSFDSVAVEVERPWRGSMVCCWPRPGSLFEFAYFKPSAAAPTAGATSPMPPLHCLLPLRRRLLVSLSYQPRVPASHHSGGSSQGPSSGSKRKREEEDKNQEHMPWSMCIRPVSRLSPAARKLENETSGSSGAGSSSAGSSSASSASSGSSSSAVADSKSSQVEEEPDGTTPELVCSVSY